MNKSDLRNSVKQEYEICHSYKYTQNFVTSQSLISGRDMHL